MVELQVGQIWIDNTNLYTRCITKVEIDKEYVYYEYWNNRDVNKEKIFKNAVSISSFIDDFTLKTNIYELW